MHYQIVTMQGRYRAMGVLVRVFQLKYESDSDQGEQSTVSSAIVEQHLRSVSFYSIRLYEGLEEQARVILVQEVTDAITAFIQRVARILIEIGQEASQRSPETPQDVMACDAFTFRNLIDRHKPRLTEAFGTAACNDIWRQRIKLTERYNDDSGFRRRVDRTARSEFMESWASVNAEGKYNLLVGFLAGLTAISPGTHTIESEFSLLKQIKSSQRYSPSNYAMEGQLQAQQYFS